MTLNIKDMILLSQHFCIYPTWHCWNVNVINWHDQRCALTLSTACCVHWFTHSLSVYSRNPYWLHFSSLNTEHSSSTHTILMLNHTSPIQSKELNQNYSGPRTLFCWFSNQKKKIHSGCAYTAFSPKKEKTFFYFGLKMLTFEKDFQSATLWKW